MVCLRRAVQVGAEQAPHFSIGDVFSLCHLCHVQITIQVSGQEFQDPHQPRVFKVMALAGIRALLRLSFASPAIDETVSDGRGDAGAVLLFNEIKHQVQRCRSTRRRKAGTVHFEEGF